jgi:DNA-binding HxlR family transcriptional regulator
MARRYEQHCGLAHALDEVGDRWTLLILRELLAGPRRYSELAAGLVSVPTNVLATRLRELEAAGILSRRSLPAPAASVVVYELTERGSGLAAALTELARWGMATLPRTTEGRPFRAHWLVLALRARFDANAASGVDESYEFSIPGDGTVRLEVADGVGRSSLGPAVDPAVRISADADTLVALTGGAITGSEAIARGAQIEGDAAAIERMGAILPVISGEHAPNAGPDRRAGG